MKTVKFLMRAYGEYNDTPRAIEAPYVGQDYDKDAIKPTILNSGDWRPTSRPLYAVEDVEIPENIITMASFLKENATFSTLDTLNGTYYPINKNIDYNTIKLNLLMSDVF